MNSDVLKFFIFSIMCFLSNQLFSDSSIKQTKIQLDLVMHYDLGKIIVASIDVSVKEGSEGREQYYLDYRKIPSNCRSLLFENNLNVNEAYASNKVGAVEPKHNLGMFQTFEIESHDTSQPFIIVDSFVEIPGKGNFVLVEPSK